MQLLFREHVPRTNEWLKENITNIVGLGWTIAVNVSGVKRVIPNHFTTTQLNAFLDPKGDGKRHARHALQIVHTSDTSLWFGRCHKQRKAWLYDRGIYPTPNKKDISAFMLWKPAMPIYSGRFSIAQQMYSSPRNQRHPLSPVLGTGGARPLRGNKNSG